VLDLIAVGPGGAIDEALELHELDRKNGRALECFSGARGRGGLGRAFEVRSELARVGGDGKTARSRVTVRRR